MTDHYDKNYFKRKFQNRWEAGKRRQDKAIAEIKDWLPPEVAVNTTCVPCGYGADTTAWVSAPNDPEDRGGPDLEIRTKSTDNLITKVEVTGFERKCPDYCYGPHKYDWYRCNAECPYCVLAVYEQPHTSIAALWPDPYLEGGYPIQNTNAGKMIVFEKDDPEVHLFSDFIHYVTDKYYMLIVAAASADNHGA